MGNVIGIEQAMKRKYFLSEEMTLPAPISGNLLVTNRASPFRDAMMFLMFKALDEKQQNSIKLATHEKSETLRFPGGPPETPATALLAKSKMRASNPSSEEGRDGCRTGQRFWKKIHASIDGPLGGASKSGEQCRETPIPNLWPCFQS
jgi:hypothetical protein